LLRALTEPPLAPFCQPELGVELKKKKLSMGEQLEGHDLTNSG